MNRMINEEVEAERVLKLGRFARVNSLGPEIQLAKKRAARARVLIREGGNLWEAAALALTGEVVKIHFRDPETGSQGLSTFEEGKISVMDDKTIFVHKHF